MNRNRNFGKLVEGQVEYAPSVLVIGDTTYFNPHAEHYLAAPDGPYYPVVADFPSQPAPEGYHYEARGWKLADGAVRRVYATVQDPPPLQPVYDRYKLVCALEEAGLLGDFMEILKTDPVLEFKWASAKQLDYDDNVLETGIAAMKSALGVTDEQIAAILAASEVEAY